MPKLTLLSFAVVMISFFLNPQLCQGQQVKKHFSVADEIDLVMFHPAYDLRSGGAEIQFSPDGNYFAVWSERGQLNLNRVEDSLRIYKTQEVMSFLEHSNASEPSPVWVVSRSHKEGRVIRDWRWLVDSSGLAFLEPIGDYNYRIDLADLRKKSVEFLTSSDENVSSFDVRDHHHFVYTAADQLEVDKRYREHKELAIVGTGRVIFPLLFPDDPIWISWGIHNYLHAVVAGKHFEVERNGMPIIPDGMALSPDGHLLVTKLPVEDIPLSWQILYPPPYASSSAHIHAGHFDLQKGDSSARQFVLINLQAGTVTPLTDAPTSSDAGWDAHGNPQWSSDGQAVLLPGTFLGVKNNAPSRPCVAIVNISSGTRTCVDLLKGHTGPGENDVEEGYHLVQDAQFVDGDKQRVVITFAGQENHLSFVKEYHSAVNDTWQVVGQNEDRPPNMGTNGLKIIVREGLNEPPQLFAVNNQEQRAIWDPNPQLKNIELTKTTIYTWKDAEGQEFKAGLFLPSDYQPGRRYPLVIQTHGFADSAFLPSGLFNTAFAARALAAEGIIVLQVGNVGHCHDLTPDEGPCNASGYKVVADRLVSEGLVDPDRIGMIGFSRTCFYVMEALITNSLHIKAASITDGVMENYFQYILIPERASVESNPMIGAPPFGEGLQLWLKRSPSFNLDKITAPLSINTVLGPVGLLGMLEPYAALHYLHRPVDLIMIKGDEHVLTNPVARVASQGGSVDWFRFWLQGYEDPDPAKAEQYNRWRGLRQIQTEQAVNDNRTTSVATSK